MPAIELLQELANVPAPPGQECELAALVVNKAQGLGFEPQFDPKGNVLIHVGPGDDPKIVVTAHLDELALMCTGIYQDGALEVAAMGGLHPWKWGESPVEILASEPIPGVLSFGSVHTESPAATATQAKSQAVQWDQTRVFTGRAPDALEGLGVRPGTRVAMARSRRQLTRLGEFVAGYFLDDRADLATWLIMLERFAANPPAAPILFAATVSEEVGGHGALYLLQRIRPDHCLALELGPIVPDSPADLCEIPTVWAFDSFAATDPRDLDILAGLGMPVQFQALSSGGSDATCAASHGLCARPVTLGIPMDNSHGYEIVHRDGIDRLAELASAYIGAVLT
jgi:putative aminopeptidase FrvX